jgi:hypothetical protein
MDLRSTVSRFLSNFNVAFALLGLLFVPKIRVKNLISLVREECV